MRAIARLAAKRLRSARIGLALYRRISVIGVVGAVTGVFAMLRQAIGRWVDHHWLHREPAAQLA